MRLTRLAASLAAALLYHASAHAQGTAPTADDADGNDSSTTLDQIVVTGEKTERSLQDTTTSVAVTTAERIQQENLQDLYQIFNRTANVGQTYSNAGFTIRGIADREGGGFAPLATIYLDGAALPYTITASAPASLWDISQVEILRGPQSTIQGENALAGAIILRTEDPHMDWDARARVVASDPADNAVSFAGGGPLIADELALRVSAERRDFDGYVDNPTRHQHEDDVQSTLARAKLLWTPSAIPGLEARLVYTWFDREGAYPFTYSRLDVDDPYDNRYNFSDAPNTDDTRTDAATLSVDYEFNDAWSLHGVTAWDKANTIRYYDGDLTEEPLSTGGNRIDSDTFSQELRLSYDGERMTGLIGLFHSRQDSFNAGSSLTHVPTPLSTISGLLQANGLDATTAAQIAGLYVGALPAIPVDYSSTTPSRAENKALFADGEFKLNEAWSLLGGFRYDLQSYRFGTEAIADFAGTLPNPNNYGAPGSALNNIFTAVNQAVLGFVAQASGQTPSSTRDFKTFLPKFGVRHIIDEDLSVSLVAQRGYRSGGSAYNIARSQSFAYDPEYTWNYEASLRSTWLDGKLALNANAYYIDWKDKQVYAYFGLNNFDNHTVNAGQAHLFGGELELTHFVSPAFDWYASIGYSRTRYDEFKTVLGGEVDDYSGSEFAYAPRWTLGVGTNWRFAEHWVANLNAGYRNTVRTDAGPTAERLSARTLVNAKIGYEALNWGAWLFGNNLFDDEYQQYRIPGEPNAVLGAPRVIGVGAEYLW